MLSPGMNHIRWMTTSAALVVITAMGCPPSSAQGPTPAARFATVDSANPSNDLLRAYIQSLRFLKDHVSSDVRMMDSAHVNQIARVEPAEGVELLTAGHLTRGGRITARIQNLRGQPISRFAVAPKGTTYLWVQYLREQWKGVLISTDSTGAIVGRAPVRVSAALGDHPSKVSQALARFSMDSTYALAARLCVPCPQYGWCWADSLGTATWAY